MKMYEPPTAKLDDKPKAHPAFYLISLWLLLASIGAGILLAVIELVAGTTISSTGFLSTFLPTYAVGTIVGAKTGHLLPSKVRMLSIGLWFCASLLIGGLYIAFLDPLILDYLTSTSAGYHLLIIGVLLVMLMLSMFIFKLGEKTGIKQFNKAN